MYNDAYIIRQICLAQIASDAGKGLNRVSMREDHGPHRNGYDDKIKFIVNAITAINSRRNNKSIWYYCTECDDQNGYPSVLVYFSVKVDGKRYQISFHNPWNRSSELIPFIGKGTVMRWNRSISSWIVCKILVNHYNL